MSIEIFDIIGIGLGPFNLSLAALSKPHKHLRTAFFERKTEFNWHPGLLMEDCTLQVPFMADLVTMADPTSKFSYLNYLHDNNRLYNFYFYEDFQIPRRDYNFYCRWVSQQLSSCHFSSEVINVERLKKDDSIAKFKVFVKNTETGSITTYLTKNIVLGVGSTPSVPASLEHLCEKPNVCHSAYYLNNKTKLQQSDSITVLGSGQSAAEIVLDLLDDQPHFGYEINWLTRSEGFLPMEYSKLGLEHFSPEYIDYFHALSESQRDKIRSGQDLWYKGISDEHISAIYDRIYRRTQGNQHCPITLQARSEVINASSCESGFSVEFRHLEKNQNFSVNTDALILATGHSHQLPHCLDSLTDELIFDDKHRPVVNRDYSLKSSRLESSNIYVQNLEIHSHGIGAPDLGLGAYRSASLLNTISGHAMYKINQKNVFQTFGIAEKWLNKKSEVQHQQKITDPV